MQYFQVVIGHGKESQVYDVKDHEIHEEGRRNFEIIYNGELILTLDQEGTFLKHAVIREH